MKTIEIVPVWDNGVVQEAKVFNTLAGNVILNTSATFWYGMYSLDANGAISNQLAQGNLIMSGDAYTQWETDSYAWDWVATQLNLVITGDYVQPVEQETV